MVLEIRLLLADLYEIACGYAGIFCFVLVWFGFFLILSKLNEDVFLFKLPFLYFKNV